MICTFGDTTDVMWWRELQLPTRAIVGLDGRIKAEPPDAISQAGDDAYAEIAGKTVKQAQKIVVEQLARVGRARRRAAPDHAPGEVLRARRPSARDRRRRASGTSATAAATPNCAPRSRSAAGELHWIPPYMRARYEAWIEGLNGDWLVSRQRFFGVPFPVWYRLDADGNVDYDDPILAPEESLPVDPSTDVPAGLHRRSSGASRTASSAIPT